MDDVLDGEPGSSVERIAFIRRQKSLLENSYRGELPHDMDIHEDLLVELVQHDTEKNSGLQMYLRNVMAVMRFDVNRRGRLISQNEMNEYTRWLASAASEVMDYFFGHGSYSPHNEAYNAARCEQ